MNRISFLRFHYLYYLECIKTHPSSIFKGKLVSGTLSDKKEMYLKVSSFYFYCQKSLHISVNLHFLLAQITLLTLRVL